MNGSLTVKNDKYYIVLSWYDDNGKRKQKWIKTGLPEKNNRRKAEEMLQKYAFPGEETDAGEPEEQDGEDTTPEVQVKASEPEPAPKSKIKRRAGLMFTDVVPF